MGTNGGIIKNSTIINGVIDFHNLKYTIPLRDGYSRI